MSPHGVKSLAQAVEKAEHYLRSKNKLAELITHAIGKAKDNFEFLLAPWESLQILLRMIRAWINGSYSAPFLTLVGGVAALVYLVEPFDLVPDAIPAMGYLDDAAVITAVVRANLTEISRFRNWETSLLKQ